MYKERAECVRSVALPETVVRRSCVFYVPVGGVEAHVAQSAEHVLGKDEVSGSIPLMGSIRRREQVVTKGYVALSAKSVTKQRKRRRHHGEREIRENETAR